MTEVSKRLFFPKDLPGGDDLLAIHAPDQKLAIIAELFSHLIIGNGPRREPDNLTEEMVEPNDALLFKSDLRSLLDGLKRD